MTLDISQYEAVIFDMDGILIDSEPLWKIAMDEVFRSVGSKLNKQDFQKTVGLRIDEVVNFWHKHEGWEEVSPKNIEDLIIHKMQQLIQNNGKPLTGVVETLQYLKKKGKKIGLGTSSYRILIETVLSTLNIADYFHVTHSAEHESHGKPHPAVYLTVAEKLGVHASKCLVIEDSLNGIIAAKAARMHVVCIPEKTHHPESKLNLADFHFEDMLLMLNEL